MKLTVHFITGGIFKWIESTAYSQNSVTDLSTLDYLNYGHVLNFSSKAWRLFKVENNNEVLFKNEF